jgi:hypothetical protein
MTVRTASWVVVLQKEGMVNSLLLKLRTHQRTVYRPGEICQWDLWETSRPVAARASLPALC